MSRPARLSQAQMQAACDRFNATYKVGNATGFICGPRTKPKRCKCGSGLPADLLCDWKVKGKTSGTCDAPICAKCTHKPKPDKDLCPTHRAEWEARAA